MHNTMSPCFCFTSCGPLGADAVQPLKEL